MQTTQDGPQAAKQNLRQRARAARDAQPDRDRLSTRVLTNALALPEAQQAQTVLWYVSCGSEVATREALQAALTESQRIIIPYCTVDAAGSPCLGLWWLHSLSELEPGRWDIPEPPLARRDEPERTIAPVELDLVLVPGVAFSPQGDRLGNGAGYYDRLLPRTRDDCLHIGIGFECQLFADIPMDPHDRRLHGVATEQTVYR